MQDLVNKLVDKFGLSKRMVGDQTCLYLSDDSKEVFRTGINPYIVELRTSFEFCEIEYKSGVLDCILMMSGYDNYSITNVNGIINHIEYLIKQYNKYLIERKKVKEKNKLNRMGEDFV